MLVHELLQATAARVPERLALIEGDATLTYAQLLARVERVAAGLERRGVGASDRVALLLPNCIEFAVAYFAVLRLGAIVVPLNTRLAPAECAYALEDSTAKLLILDEAFRDTYQEFRETVQTLEGVVQVGPGQSAPHR